MARALPASRIEILAAADGAPEAWLDGERAPVSVSLSHRGGRALAAVAAAPAVVGCDLELVEPRSGAFVREWLAPAEQALVAALDGPSAPGWPTSCGPPRRRPPRCAARGCGSTCGARPSTSRTRLPRAADLAAAVRGLGTGGRAATAGLVARRAGLGDGGRRRPGARPAAVLQSCLRLSRDDHRVVPDARAGSRR